MRVLHAVSMYDCYVETLRVRVGCTPTNSIWLTPNQLKQTLMSFAGKKKKRAFPKLEASHCWIVGLLDCGTCSFFAWRIFRGHISLYDLDPHAVQAEVSFGLLGLLGSRKESKAVCHWKKTHVDIHKLRDKLVDFQLESDREHFFLQCSANFCFFRNACWMDTKKGMYEEFFPSKWVLQRL